MIQFNVDPEAPDDMAEKKYPKDDWFHNPLDDMPIATDNPRPEEEIADAYASVSYTHLTLPTKRIV